MSQRTVESKDWLHATAQEVVYYTVCIPWVAPEIRTMWHPTDSEGLLSTLTRGCFDTPKMAYEWAKENLNGTPYTILRCEFEVK